MTAPALSRRGRHRVLAVLCATEVIAYGVLFYAFPVLAGDVAADTGWTAAELTGAFSLALVVSALVGVPVGRVLDRAGPRSVMTAGSELAVPAVLAVLGWFVPNGFGLVPIGGNDVWLHALLAVVLLAVGLTSHRDVDHVHTTTARV